MSFMFEAPAGGDSFGFNETRASGQAPPAAFGMNNVANGFSVGASSSAPIPFGSFGANPSPANFGFGGFPANFGFEGTAAAAAPSSTQDVPDGQQAIWDDNEDEDVGGDEYQADIPQQFSKVREKIRSVLTTNVTERNKDAELNYLITTTQALVISNNEIWDRCKPNLEHQSNQFNQLSRNNILRFKRVGFNDVQVLSQRSRQSKLVFQTKCMWQTKTFTVPFPLPFPLSTVVAPPFDRHGMVNYSEYLKRSFILEESILLPFLAILKDHLEDFQVFLGNVESWLMGSFRSVFFVRETFNVALQVPTNANAESVILNGPSVLKTIESSRDYSQYNIMFDISNSNGQERVTKFLAFVTHQVCDD